MEGRWGTKAWDGAGKMGGRAGAGSWRALKQRRRVAEMHESRGRRDAWKRRAAEVHESEGVAEMHHRLRAARSKAWPEEATGWSLFVSWVSGSGLKVMLKVMSMEKP
eukprot:353079-Chlamydomonas_euryale.AAC.3